MERNSILKSPGRSRWLPILLAALMADVNFWYWASTGENDADYAGIALFVLFGAVFFRDSKRGKPRRAIALAGAIVAAVMMVLRQVGKIDFGYIPPYAVFVVFVWLGGPA